MHNKIRLFYRLLYLLAFFILPSNSFAQQQPIPDWVKDIGGFGESKVSGVAVDKFDNVYIAGNFRSTITVDLSGISAPVSLTSNGDYDVFIAKYTPDGKLIWAKSIGGSELDQVNNLTVDDESNVIFGGQFSSFSMDCDPGSGTFNLNNAGGNDAFIVKLDLDGNFKWAKNVGGSSTEYGHVVAADRLGNVIFVGSYSSNISLGGFNLLPKGGLDGFMVKYDKNGNIQWAYGFGSFGTDEIRHVITNTNNEIIIMGYFSSGIDLNPKGPANNITGTSPNYFIAKYTGTGQLIWSDKIDGATAVVSSLASGPNNDIYLTGVYSGTVTLSSPTNNVALTSTGGKNLFVGKYSSAGAALWGKNIGGNSSTPYSYYITADIDDNVYIGGYFDGTLIFGDASLNKTLTFHGVRDTFFGKYTGTGKYVWAFNFGSSCSGNFGHKIAVDSKKNVLLGGSFCSTVDFNPGICELKITAKNGTSDGYISKYNQIKFTGDANIISFELAEQTAPALINTQDKTITIKVRAGTNVTALKPTLTTDIGVVAPLSGVANNFTQPQKYIITSNCQDYTWLVTVQAEETNEITICSGATQILVGVAANTRPSYTYLWQIKDPAGNWIAAPNASASIDYELKGLTNFTNQDITYQFRRKVFTANTELIEPDINIIIHPATTNNLISTTENVLCSGASNVVITGTVPQGAENETAVYKWQESDDELTWRDINNATGIDLSVSVAKTKYFKRLTFSASCISYSNTLKIEVQPQVTASIAGNNIALCNNDMVTLNANAVAMNETGTWQVVSPASYHPFNAVNEHNPSLQITNIPADVDVVLKWTISQNICSTSSSSTITIHNYSEAILTLPSNITISEGQSVKIPATITPVINNYTFTWSPSTGLDHPDVLTPTSKPDKTTVYHLKITYGNSCVIEKDIRIGIDKTTKLAICSGETVQLTGEAFIGSSPVIQWQFFDFGTWVNIQNGNNADFSLKTIEHFENTPIIMLYRRMITTGGTSYFDSKYEISTSPHTRNNIISTETLNYCGKPTVPLSIMGSDPTGAADIAVSYAWELSNDGENWSIIGSETGKDIVLNSLTQTGYFRRTTYSNSCVSLSNVLKITLNPLPTIADAGENLSLCGKSFIVLSGNKPGGNEVGTWSVISPVNFNPFTAANINNPNAVINNLPSGQQVVLQWEIANNNCNTTTKDEVEIISYRDISVTAPAKLTIDYGKVVNLNVITDLGDEPYTFEWLPKTGLKNQYSLSPDASPRENTTYTLKINYGLNCSKSIPIEVIVLNTIDIPKSFSPNGDGINDSWNIGNILNYPGSKISVYNRYGVLMYQNTNTLAAWDGTNKGKLVLVGVYYYVIELKDKYNSVYNGSIMVLQ
ncbi:gliding motility-associated C-terminal domain-containing protein [Pedobacter sp. 22163]|uniref:T9SS type B sorting domain-containing protein n=1 Tax=Pedobacter sp. 22163 TaxID=3453883 RepID=UPI003F836FB4